PPLDVKREPGLVLQPDLLVVPAGELRRRADTVRRLLLAVDIVSPSSARHDRVRKRPHYQRTRVPEHWTVRDTSPTPAGGSARTTNGTASQSIGSSTTRRRRSSGGLPTMTAPSSWRSGSFG